MAPPIAHPPSADPAGTPPARNPSAASSAIAIGRRRVHPAETRSIAMNAVITTARPVMKLVIGPRATDTAGTNEPVASTDGKRAHAGVRIASAARPAAAPNAPALIPNRQASGSERRVPDASRAGKVP